jgi:glycosyltransferase involved in cell wall biosynthesis
MHKIAIIVTKSEFGGGQEYIRILMSLITGTKFILITGDTGFLTEVARNMNVSVYVCKHLIHPVRPLRDIKAIIEVYKILRHEKPCLLHANSSKAGIVGRIAARFADVPSVFTAHGWAFSEGVSARRAWIAKWTEKLVSPCARKIICVSHYDRNLALKNGVGRTAQLVTIHNGIPDTKTSLAAHFNVIQRIIMVARFAPPKDYTTLLRAIANFKSNELQLECVGDGPQLNPARQLAQQLGLQDRVKFHGARSDVAEILQSADIFVLLTRWEGLPISILEAMRAGLPVVATRVGGVPEAVEDQVTGLLVERSDTEGVVKALRTLTSQPHLRKQMGQAGRERFLRLFSSHHMALETGKIYANIIGGHKAGPAANG